MKRAKKRDTRVNKKLSADLNFPSPLRGEGKGGGEMGGFTLIEVLVAIVILTVGLLAVGTMQISAIRGNFMGGNTSIALSLASEKMEDLLNSDFNDPPGVQKLTDRITGNNATLSSTTAVDWDEYVSEEGAVGAGGFYRRIWNIANVPTVSPTTKNVVVTVTWENNRHRVSIASVKNQVVH
jgi:prepilin-type N-terminal cleavage/methylation domain-containing protein